jgi:hypothetical protein
MVVLFLRTCSKSASTRAEMLGAAMCLVSLHARRPPNESPLHETFRTISPITRPQFDPCPSFKELFRSSKDSHNSRRSRQRSTTQRLCQLYLRLTSLRHQPSTASSLSLSLREAGSAQGLPIPVSSSLGRSDASCCSRCGTVQYCMDSISRTD